MAETHRQEKTPQACSLPPASPDQARAPPPPAANRPEVPPKHPPVFPGTVSRGSGVYTTRKYRLLVVFGAVCVGVSTRTRRTRVGLSHWGYLWLQFRKDPVREKSQSNSWELPQYP